MSCILIHDINDTCIFLTKQLYENTHIYSGRDMIGTTLSHPEDEFYPIQKFLGWEFPVPKSHGMGKSYTPLSMMFISNKF